MCLVRRSAFALALLMLIAGCKKKSPEPPQRTVVASGSLVTFEEQGWQDREAEWFYNVSQGSQLIPYAWIKALKSPEQDQLFVESIPSFGYIARRKSKENPNGLPVGFLKDEGKEKEYLSVNCAACHTGLIEYGDNTYLVDGAPALGDMQKLLESLVLSLELTKSDETRFAAFAEAVLGRDNSHQSRADLRQELDRVLTLRKAYNDRNFPKDERYRFGPGRVDAFGAILNEVTCRFLGIPENHEDANAPVSYPFLWDTPYHDVVQWNGVAPNGKAGLGNLARNVGEVLGVFGNVDIPEEQPKGGYPSTVQIRNLLRIEAQLKKLKSPQWPSSFGLDKDKARKGREHYVKLCAECHTLNFNRDDPNRTIIADMKDVGTDPLMSQNFRNRMAKTGRLEGQWINFVPSNAKFGEQAKGETILIHSVVGTILGSWKEAPDETTEIVLVDKAVGVNAYKGRPLNGIWATAPYLHNGSVPTLRDLLKPAAHPDPKQRRPAKFWVGSREFDPAAVGFKSDDGTFEFDTSLPGNWNVGHEYGTGSTANGSDGVRLKDHEADELLEFLKTL